MKLKNNEIDAKKLRTRLITSISLGIIFFTSVIFLFRSIQNQEKINNAPSVIRHSFEWNAKIWSKLNSPSNLSVKKKTPEIDILPRVNGEIGLNDEINYDSYKVTVISGDKKINLPITAFKLINKVGYSTDFRCIEGWSDEIQYAGARFSDFIKHYNLGKKLDGTYYNYVGLETPDKKYYVSIDMESMLHPQTVLAYEMNSEPLLEENGAPLRLIIPVKYGIKNLKRIGTIFFSDERPRDYWAEKGYDWYSGL